MVATKFQKHGSFKEHAKALKSLLSAQTFTTKGRVVLIYGNCDVLLSESIRQLRELAALQNITVNSSEATLINEANIGSICQQGSLFEPATLFLLKRAELSKDLVKTLSKFPQSTAGLNHLCLVYQSDNPPAQLISTLNKLDALLVPCLIPWPNEIPQVIHALAESLGARLTNDSVTALLSATGDDLTNNFNELKKISLISGRSKAKLTATEINSHLGMLRTDDLRLLEHHLLEKQWAKALAMANRLMTHGEKALSLVAVIANHCRTIIKLSMVKLASQSPQAIAAATAIPPFVIKTYAPFLNHPIDLAPYLETLKLCQEADLTLKSERISENLLISRMIDALAVTAYN